MKSPVATRTPIFKCFFCNEPTIPIHKINLRLKFDIQTFGVFRTPMTHPIKGSIFFNDKAVPFKE